MAQDIADRRPRGAGARRRAIATAGAAGVHLAALLVLAPPFGLGAQPVDPGVDDAEAPAIIVDLAKPLSRAPGRTAERSPDRPALKPVEALPVSSARAFSPAPPGPSESRAAGTTSNDDGLFRVPFRDAVAQASSELRAGLACAHVDLPRLPAWMRDQCAGTSGQPPAWVVSAFPLAERDQPAAPSTSSHSPPAR